MERRGLFSNTKSVVTSSEKIMIDNCQPRSLTFHDLKYGYTTLVLIFWTLEPAVHKGAPP
jgi:hypothetical protein